MLPSYFVIIGFFINILGQVGYIIQTLKGRNKPNRVTWFFFALIPFIALSAQIEEGVGIQALQTFVVGFGPAMIFLASFLNPKAIWKITKFDIGCGMIAALAIILWLATGKGALAVIFSIVADTFAAIPTIVKSWKAPETETSWIFLFAATNATLTLLTIKTYTFMNTAFAVYILATCLLLFSLIQFKLGLKFKQIKAERQSIL